MATIRPFHGIHYANRPDLELSMLLAPPYDVLDEAGKAALQARHPNNIVTIDLPFLPPKSLGPQEVYDKANTTFQAWLSAGVLVKDKRPATYPYSQTYEHNGKTFHRRGFFCLVKLSPFGEGQVVPHEKTYKGPIEDRLRLMHTTGAQMSPVFGLFNDNRGEITKTLFQHIGKPLLDGHLDGVRNQLWAVIDADVENEIIRMMGTKPIYIADGHHRYTTALQYKAEVEKAHGGPLPPNHPANYCLFCLVNMYDDGLLILPTHRLIGGLQNFDIDAFRSAVHPHFSLSETPITPDRMQDLADAIVQDDPHTFGLYDAKTKKSYKLKLVNMDVLKPLEPKHSEAWRSLDVAILQRYLLDEVLKPKFAGGQDPTKGYSSDAKQIVPHVDGKKFQIALLLRPTPLPALEELGRHDEVMPQKSTYFFPKLATGMIINPLK